MINRVTLLGRLGKDADVKVTPGGTSILKASIATTENFKDKEGNKQQATEWHTLVAFGKRFEALAQYLRKGQLIYVEGKITTRSYEDKDKVKKYTTEIIVHDIQLCGKSDQSPTDHKPSIDSIFDNIAAPKQNYLDDMEVPF